MDWAIAKDKYVGKPLKSAGKFYASVDRITNAPMCVIMDACLCMKKATNAMQCLKQGIDYLSIF